MEDRAISEVRSLILFLAGVAVVVALLTLWGGWALPVVIAAIFVMVMGHEFGHYIVAKREGMKVTDFFVGFGPVIWSTTRGDTRYGVRALLLGGYVKVPGMTWGEPLPEAQEKRTYRSATYPRKVLFASAGSLMHLLMALVLAYASLAFIGSFSSSAVGVSAFTTWQGHKQNAAQLAGLKIGDRIEAIDGKRVTSPDELVNQVHHSVGKNLTLTVVRHGTTVTLHATPVAGGSINVNKYVVARGDDESVVLYWYQSQGRVIADEFAAKFYLIADSIRRHRSDTSLVRVVVPVSKDDREKASRTAVEFVQAVYPVVDSWLPR